MLPYIALLRHCNIDEGLPVLFTQYSFRGYLLTDIVTADTNIPGGRNVWMESPLNGIGLWDGSHAFYSVRPFSKNVHELCLYTLYNHRYEFWPIV